MVAAQFIELNLRWICSAARLGVLKFSYRLVFVVVVVVQIVGFNFSAQAAMVKLLRQADVSKPVILLGDVAEVVADSAAQKKWLEQIEIADLQDRKRLTVTADLIRKQLQQAGLSLHQTRVVGHRQCLAQYQKQVPASEALGVNGQESTEVQVSNDLQQMGELSQYDLNANLNAQVNAKTIGNNAAAQAWGHTNQTQDSGIAKWPVGSLGEVVHHAVCQAMQVDLNQVQIHELTQLTQSVWGERQGVGGGSPNQSQTNYLLNQPIYSGATYQVVCLDGDGQALNATSLGQAEVKLKAMVGGRVVSTMVFDIQIKRRVWAWVAKQTIRAGRRIRESDLNAQWVWVSDSSAYVQVGQYLEDWRALDLIQAGDVLKPEDLPKPVVIQRGDVVVVQSQVGQAVIHLQAVAQQEGRLDESIRLRIPGRRQPYFAIVTGVGTAEMR